MEPWANPQRSVNRSVSDSEPLDLLYDATTAMRTIQGLEPFVWPVSPSLDFPSRLRRLGPEDQPYLHIEVNDAVNVSLMTLLDLRVEREVSREEPRPPSPREWYHESKRHVEITAISSVSTSVACP